MKNTVNGVVEITPQVQLDAAKWWRDHHDALKREGGLEDKDLQMIWILGCDPKNIGFDSGQIRPGELGQWDVFFRLQQGGWSEGEATRMAGLSGPQVRKMERDTYLQDLGVDPDDPEEVAEFERIQQMGPRELDAHIEVLQSALAAAG